MTEIFLTVGVRTREEAVTYVKVLGWRESGRQQQLEDSRLFRDSNRVPPRQKFRGKGASQARLMPGMKPRRWEGRCAQ
jgi:hypothetical protein